MAEYRIFPSAFRDRTRELLADFKKKRGYYREIAQETGLSETWVSMFHRGLIECPDVARVQTLYCFLTDEPFTIQR